MTDDELEVEDEQLNSSSNHSQHVGFVFHNN